jgi:hypothetical protein
MFPVVRVKYLVSRSRCLRTQKRPAAPQSVLACVGNAAARAPALLLVAAVVLVMRWSASGVVVGQRRKEYSSSSRLERLRAANALIREQNRTQDDPDALEGAPGSQLMRRGEMVFIIKDHAAPPQP